MPINRYLLKQEGRAALRDAHPNALFMTLMYILLTDGISLVVSLFVDDPLYEIQSLIQAGLDPWRSVLIALAGAGMVGLFVYILLSLYRFVMSFSYRRWALRVARREECAMSDLVAGFGMPGRSVLLGILTTLLYVMWYLIIFLPVLLLTFVFMLLFSVVGLVFVIPLVVAGLVLYFLKISQYSMADFCLADAPQDGVLAAIRRSRAMMAGSCGSYLLLMLSFLGWYLLAALISFAAEGIVLVCMVSPGVLVAAAAGDLSALMTLSNAMGSPLVTVVTFLAAIPLSLWLSPYLSITSARFYELLRAAAPQGPTHYRYE